MTEKDFTTFKIISICNGGGYKYCRTVPLHPKANSKGLYPLHRVLAENKEGRFLQSWEHVHHKDENKSNNSADNLEVMTASEHARAHSQVDTVDCVCPVCSGDFTLKPHQYNLRKRRNKSGLVACSRSCGNKLARR